MLLVAELTNLEPDVVEITWYCRYLDERVMLPVLADTVAQAVHAPEVGFVFGPERTWIVTVVPAGAVTSRVSVSHPTTAPASTTADTYVDELAYVPTRAQ